MSNYHIDWQSANAQGIPRKEPIILPQKLLDSTSTSITLTGRGVNNYGEIQQENFLRLMENFASATPPAHPTIGQMWWNNAENILYLHVDELTNTNIPLYYPQSPARWAQIWPAVNAYASISEYSALATTINRIIGAPSSDGANEEQQFGWGQNDLVPEYLDINTLKPGFSDLIFPKSLDNNSWVILLSRLRKALRHIGVSESAASPVGFIADGRPTPGGNTLANTYNNYPSVGALPDYTSGWGGVGPVTLSSYYVQTIAAIALLQAQRFKMAGVSSETAQIVSFNRTANWATTLDHTVTMTFASEDAAKAYFNAGGYVRFAVSHTPTTIDSINTSWQTFLAAQTNLIMDYKGMRIGNTYLHASTNGTGILGFYDLTTSFQEMYRRNREESLWGVYSSYGSVTDGAFRIQAKKTINGLGQFVIDFIISFIEAATGAEVLTGQTSSAVWSNKPSSLNVNQPVLPYPTGVQGGSFTL